MYKNFRVEVPQGTGRINMNHKGDRTYVEYTYERVYIPEKRYARSLRTTIGKLCPDDPSKMWPNPNFFQFFPDVPVPELDSKENRCLNLNIGAFLVIRKIANDYGLPKMLKKIVGTNSELLLDFAAYTIITENNAAQHYPNYAKCHPLFSPDMHIYSDSSISRFFHEVTADQSAEFLNAWTQSRDKKEKIYISYDSTNKVSQAGDISIVEMGHSKASKDTDTIFNFSIAYDLENGEPVFYEDYAGSIVDVSQLQYMVLKAKAYGYEKIGFVLDRGYFSQDNFRYLDNQGYDFIIMMKGKKDFVRNLVLEVKGTFENRWENSISQYAVEGITVAKKLYPTDEKERYFHIYYSSHRFDSEKRKTLAEVNRMKRYLKKREGQSGTIGAKMNKYFEPSYENESMENQVFITATPRLDVINEEIGLGGYFVIITSQQMSAEEAITLYKSRDVSEKLFRGDKSYTGNTTMRVHDDESLETKIFVEFIALIIRNKIYTCLKKEKEAKGTNPNYMTVPAAISELENIQMGRQGDRIYRLGTAVTKTQKEILQAFGITEPWVKKEAEKISNLLKPGEEIEG